MREIKFRAWNKETCRMLPNEEISRTTHGEWFVWDEYDNSQDSGFELLQFTGLKDKNGKEIYEGDVVRHKEREIGLLQVYWDMFKACWYMETLEDLIACPLGDEQQQKGGWRNTPAFQLNLEVIGNIYENPDLIK